ncbi:hypothetical protein WN71_006665 [Streptomyces mangrovisoli]|uniref:DUF5666 domain-containing protein n=2 Tax=Streptomyces mangrovisoli TaxID=1428628 RepID=A0A1J4P1T2_9ACTN|nr:hypothetical protein WN71_006665 [Streptomyces mangrovisoli]
MPDGAPPPPPVPPHPPQAEWEVLAAPGADREPLGAALRSRWERQSGRARALTVAAAVVALAAGGTVAYAATSAKSGADGVPAAAASPSGSPSQGGPGRDGHGPGSWFGFGAVGDGVHGEATVKDQSTGKYVVRIWQRGTVQQISGDQVTVKSDDGAQWTWTVGSGVSVRKNDSSSSGASALAKGDTVLLVGTRSGDTRTATTAVEGDFTGNRPGGGSSSGPGDGQRPFGGGHGPWDRGDRSQQPSPSPSESGEGT